MTQEQLKYIEKLVANSFDEKKEVNSLHFVVLLGMLAIQDRVNKLINDEAFSYQDFKDKIVGYYPEVKDYLRTKGYDLTLVRDFNIENDFAENRHGYIYEDYYSLEGEQMKKAINEQMKKKFFGGEELTDKQKDYFNKQPLSTFSKNSLNVFNNIFNEKDENGEVKTKDLSVDTVNKSLNGFKAMNDKVKSLGIFDILFHLPSYFGLKKNIKNLKNSLVEKGLDANLINKVENNEATPKEASLDYLYNSDEKFKELVDNNNLTKEAAYESFKGSQEKVEEKTVEEKVEVKQDEPKIEEVTNEVKLERKDEEKDHEKNIEPNQQYSRNTKPLVKPEENQKIKDLYEKGKGEIESKEYTQFEKASHLKGKNTSLEQKKSRLHPNKYKVTEEDLKNPKIQKKFDERLDTLTSNVNSTVSRKIRKSTIVPKDDRLKTSAEMAMESKKDQAKRISAIKNLKLANDEVNKVAEEIRIKNEEFDPIKIENENAQKYINDINSKFANQKERNNYFKDHQDEKQKYDDAIETTTNFISKASKHNNEIMELNSVKHEKMAVRFDAFKNYEKVTLNKNTYNKIVEKYDLTEDDKKILQNKNDYSANRTDIFKKMLGNDLEEILNGKIDGELIENQEEVKELKEMVYTPEQKLEMKNMLRDNYIETRNILDNKLSTIKEDEMEDLEEDNIEREGFLQKLDNDTTVINEEVSQINDNDKSKELEIKPKSK